MRLLITAYIRLKYLILLDIPLAVARVRFAIRLRFMSKEQQRREMDESLRRMLLSSWYSTEDKQALIEATKILRELGQVPHG